MNGLWYIISFVAGMFSGAALLILWALLSSYNNFVGFAICTKNCNIDVEEDEKCGTSSQESQE